MIDQKFSANAFAKAGFGTPEARELCRQLQQAVLAELDSALSTSWQSVIEQLNLLGHNLKPYGPQSAGERHYREPNTEESSHYKFLLALDTVISVGYPHTTDGIDKYE